MKHNSKRRMIAILLVVAMVLAMLPSTAFASVDDELWVNGEDIFLAKDNTVQCGNGTATYNPSTFTLTLNNATIDKKYQSYSIAKLNTNAILNVVANGTNNIICTEDDANNHGIFSQGSLSISGNGTLNITTKSNDPTSPNNEYVDSAIYSKGKCEIQDTTINMNNIAPTSSSIDSLGIWIHNDASNDPSFLKNAKMTFNGFKNAIKIVYHDLYIKGCDIKAENTNTGINGWYGDSPLSIMDSNLDFKVVGTNAIGLLSANDVMIDNSSLSIESPTSNAIFSDKNLTIQNNSNVNAKGFYPALFSVLDTKIINSTVNANSSDDSAIFTTVNIIIDGNSNISARGKYAAISATENITVNNGKINATSTADMGLWSRNSLTINGGEVHAKGAEGYAAIGVRNEKQPDDTDPVAKITISDKLKEVSGAKVSVSDWFNQDVGGTTHTRSWTSFIANDENKLETTRSNAVNEITLKEPSPIYIPQIPSVVIKDNLGGKTTYSSHNSTLTITPDKGYQIKDVLVNKVSKGKVSTLKGLTSADTVEVIFEKIPEKTPAQIKAEKIAKIKAGVKNTSIKTLKAKVTKGKIKLTWNKSSNYKINYYNIYRTTGKQKYKKIAKKSAMAYINSKSLKKGKIYKFKIVGARVIDGKTIYTKSKTIKVRAK